MTSYLHNPKVYAARSLEEARKIVLSNQKPDISIFIKKMFVVIWVQLANSFLWMLQSILFKRGDLSRKSFKNIVVYTHGILGDTVAALPALSALKKRHPSATVVVAADLGPLPQSPTELFESVPFVDKLIVLNNHPVRREGFRLVLDPGLRGIECDLFVNLSPYGNRGWFNAVAREIICARWLRAHYAVGFHLSTKMPRKSLKSVQHYFVKNEPLRALGVLKELGIQSADNIDLLPKNDLAKANIAKKVEPLAKNTKPVYVLNPGGNLAVKHWPAKRFSALADYIYHTYQGCVVITGTESEREIADEIASNSKSPVINIAGRTTIQELIELLRMARACITNDTGTMHLAAMTGIPTVAIFGTRISPTWWFPHTNKIIALFSLTGCSFCYLDSCDIKECLDSIGINDVVQALDDILSERTLID